MDTPEAIAASYLQRPIRIDISDALSRSWALVRDNMGMLIGGSALAWLISIGLSAIPVIGWIIGFVLLGGLDLMFLRRLRGETVQIGDVFAGFNIAFLNLAMVGLVKWLLTTIGLLLCIVPGIYLAVAYMFAMPLVIDKGMEFWPAMEVSRRVIHEHWWSMFAFAIVSILVGISGVLLCGVGLFFTLPIAYGALLFVYNDIFGGPAASSAVPAPPAPVRPA